MDLYDKCTASADDNADESSTGEDYSGEGGGAMDEGGGAIDEGGGAGNEGGGAGDDGRGDGSAGKAAKPSNAAAARRGFDSTDTPFQKHASLFALRSYVSVGFQKSLLLEGDARCDDCNEPSPGVVDYCRSPSGDRLCYSCDAARHELVPCWRERWILTRVGDNRRSAHGATVETPSEAGSQSPASGTDSGCGTERSALVKA